MTSEHFSKTEHDEFDTKPHEYVDKFTNRLIDHPSLENQHYELKTYLFNTLQKDEPGNNEKLGPNLLSINIFDTIRAMMSNNGGVIAVGIKEDVLKEKIVTQENKTSMYKDLKTEIEKIYKNKIETPTYTASSFDDKFEKYKIHATKIINHLFSTYTNYNQINCGKYFKVEQITLKKSQIHLVFIFVHPSFKEEKKYVGITDFSIYNHYPPNKQKNKYLQRDNGFNKAVNAKTIAEEEQKMKDEEPASIKAVKKAIFDGLESQSEAQRKERNAETEKIINANTQQNTPLSDSLFQDLLERLELMYADIQKQEDNDDKETLNIARKIDAKLDEYLADKLQKGDQLLHETDNYPWNEELDTFKNLRAQIINHIRFLSKNPDEEATRKIAKLKKKAKQIEDTIKFIQSKITPKTEDLEPSPLPPIITVPPLPPDPEPQPVPTPTPPPADRGPTSNGLDPKYFVIIVIGILMVAAFGMWLISNNDTSPILVPGEVQVIEGENKGEEEAAKAAEEARIAAANAAEDELEAALAAQKAAEDELEAALAAQKAAERTEKELAQKAAERTEKELAQKAADEESKKKSKDEVEAEENPASIIKNKEVSPSNSIILMSKTPGCSDEANEWTNRNSDGKTNHNIFFGAYENVCTKAIISFDLNEVQGKDIDSITFTYERVVQAAGCTRIDEIWGEWSTALTCLNPDDADPSMTSELKYKFSNEECSGTDLFDDLETWTVIQNWKASNGKHTITLDGITSVDNRHLCLAFSETGTNFTEVSERYRRLWFIFNPELEVNYLE